jgi:lysophospholipase L1-like esterase
MTRERTRTLMMRRGAVGATTYTISGTITDGVSGVDGVTVALGTYSAVTAGGGLFSITGIPAGTSGNLTATLAGYDFVPITISAMTGNLTGKDFTAYTYLLDNLSGTGAITAHTPDYLALAAQAWTILSGNWQDLASGLLKIVQDASRNYSEVVINTGFADFELIAKANFGNTITEIVARANLSDQNRLVVQKINGDAAFTMSSVAGQSAHTQLISLAYAGAAGVYWLKWWARGSQQYFWISTDGTTYTYVGQVLSATYAASTCFGFGYLNGSSTYGFDSIEVHRALWWKTVSVLGDSISTNTMWPTLFNHLYNNSRCELKNHSAGGSSIMAHMDGEVVAAASDNADIIIFALGTNDSDDAGIVAEVEENIDEIRGTNPNATVYYMNVLPRWTDIGGGTPVDKSGQRVKIATACAAKGVTCWDTYNDPWIVAGDTSDGLHPTAAGSLKIANKILALLT